MAQKTKTNQDSTNFYFLLQCTGIFTALALFATTVAIGVLKASATPTAIAATVSAVPFLPFLPLVLAGLGFAAFLTYVCLSSVRAGSAYYTTSSLYPTYFNTRPIGIGSIHGHGGVGGFHGHGGVGSVHGHGGAGGFHGHGGTGGVHGHGGAGDFHGHGGTGGVHGHGGAGGFHGHGGTGRR